MSSKSKLDKEMAAIIAKTDPIPTKPARIRKDVKGIAKQLRLTEDEIASYYSE